ncbi:MAG: hypothetical protein HQK54_15285, partial [Oligoflexales bacterium]|nr:hypothetical protein [Oligoflexales bacterium]
MSMRIKPLYAACTAIIFSAVLLAVIIFAGGCGASKDKDEEVSSKDANIIFGSVTLGPVKNAFVKAYKLNGDGSLGSEIGNGKTNDNGEYSIALKVQHEGAMEVVATGGSYVDEATGEIVERGDGEEIRTMLRERIREHVGINALSTMAAEQTRQNIKEGLSVALENANKNVAAMFGIPGVDFIKTKPHDLTDKSKSADEDSDSSKLGLAMAAFSQI